MQRFVRDARFSRAAHNPTCAHVPRAQQHEFSLRFFVSDRRNTMPVLYCAELDIGFSIKDHTQLKRDDRAFAERLRTSDAATQAAVDAFEQRGPPAALVQRIMDELKYQDAFETKRKARGTRAKAAAAAAPAAAAPAKKRAPAARPKKDATRAPAALNERKGEARLMERHFGVTKNTVDGDEALMNVLDSVFAKSASQSGSKTKKPAASAPAPPPPRAASKIRHIGDKRLLVSQPEELLIADIDLDDLDAVPLASYEASQQAALSQTPTSLRDVSFRRTRPELEAAAVKAHVADWQPWLAELVARRSHMLLRLYFGEGMQRDLSEELIADLARLRGDLNLVEKKAVIAAVRAARPWAGQQLPPWDAEDETTIETILAAAVHARIMQTYYRAGSEAEVELLLRAHWRDDTPKQPLSALGALARALAAELGDLAFPLAAEASQHAAGGLGSTLDVPASGAEPAAQSAPALSPMTLEDEPSPRPTRKRVASVTASPDAAKRTRRL